MRRIRDWMSDHVGLCDVVVTLSILLTVFVLAAACDRAPVEEKAEKADSYDLLMCVDGLKDQDMLTVDVKGTTDITLVSLEETDIGTCGFLYSGRVKIWSGQAPLLQITPGETETGDPISELRIYRVQPRFDPRYGLAGAQPTSIKTDGVAYDDFSVGQASSDYVKVYPADDGLFYVRVVPTNHHENVVLIAPVSDKHPFPNPFELEPVEEE